MATRTITGIHHISAIAGDPQRNLDFYTGVLGLRRVKLTVNFDDPGTNHLYFGNSTSGHCSLRRGSMPRPEVHRKYLKDIDPVE